MSRAADAMAAFITGMWHSIFATAIDGSECIQASLSLCGIFPVMCVIKTLLRHFVSMQKYPYPGYQSCRPNRLYALRAGREEHRIY
ncbi:hypothetical protein ACQR16_04900 [Bradyrhizobium oligotrophicum]|uniref:hypothetical protein n=1 Tax=Bradyrhizobium oligotrophicum TaxID=44255 RepID=UPI003EB7B125